MEENQINETTLTRVAALHGEDSPAIGVLSAFRKTRPNPITGENEPTPHDVNIERHARLRQRLSDLGYNEDNKSGPIQLRGRYNEIQPDETTEPVRELSYMVKAREDDPDGSRLLSHLQELGAENEQDSIVFKPKGSDRGRLHPTHGRSSLPPEGIDLGKFRPMVMNPDGSSSSRGKVFSYSDDMSMKPINKKIGKEYTPDRFQR